MLWQVGTRDGSYAEFGIAGRYESYRDAFGGGGAFEVGKGDAKKNWCYIQPGPDDKWAGEGEHPFEVIFNLDRVPEGPLLVRVDLVDVNPSDPPTLRVRVNEKAYAYDLKPGVSNDSLRDPSRGRPQTVEMYVGNGHLHVGRNVVNLTVTKGSWVLYDSVSMQSVRSVPHRIQGLSIRPTCLFKNKDGQLRQIVVASVDVYEDQPVIRTELTGDKSIRVDQSFENVPSGSADLEIEVPAPLDSEEKVHLRLTAGGEVLETDGVVTPHKLWKIYMLPTTHLDIGYTSIQDEALKVHREDVERAIGWCKRFPGFTWDLEGSVIADEYLRKGADPDTFIDLAKSGRLGVMGFFANTLTGICSGESLSRLVDFYDYLRKSYGISSECAMMTDVPTMVGTVPMILAGHGIKYLSHGINTTRALGDQEPMRYPFYWESPDGSRVLMWKVVGYGQSGDITGIEDTGSLQMCGDRVASLVQQFEGRTDYPFDAILLHGGYGDNFGNGISIAEIPERWNAVYEYPKLITCRGKEFFEYVESNFGKHIPVVKGDGGVFWEDGVGSSARETAIARVAQEQLTVAEKLIALCDARTRKETADALAEAWRNVLLYDEHTWGADISIQHPEAEKTLQLWDVKKSFADKAAADASDILNSAARRFAQSVGAAANDVVVFNPSSWARSEWVSCTLPDGRTVDLYARDVPPMGYKIIPAADATSELAVKPESDTLDNRWYTVKFDKSTGAVTSIFDKDMKRELVDSSTYGLCSYLYATAEHPNSLLGYDVKPPDTKIATVSRAVLTRKDSALGQTMEAKGEAPMAKAFSLQVALHSDQKRIDFTCNIDRIANLDKEGGYFAFPFAFRNPTIRLEIPDGVIRPEVDQIKGACKDWYSVQQFLTVSDGSAAVVWTPLDSPLVTLQDINRGQWYEHLDIRNGNVFAYVFNNYWWTNYKASQDGPCTFRFALTSGKSFTDAEAKRFGESASIPLVAVSVEGTPTGRPAAERSFVSVDKDAVIVQAVLPARFSDGTLIRLREMSGSTGSATLTVDGIDFRQAYLCNLAEDKLQPLEARNGKIGVPCRALGLTSVLLER